MAFSSALFQPSLPHGKNLHMPPRTCMTSNDSIWDFQSHSESTCDLWSTAAGQTCMSLIYYPPQYTIFIFRLLKPLPFQCLAINVFCTPKCFAFAVKYATWCSSPPPPNYYMNLGDFSTLQDRKTYWIATADHTVYHSHTYEPLFPSIKWFWHVLPQLHAFEHANI